MKVASIVLNNFTRDNRVLKENLSLKMAGFSPSVVALYDGDVPEKEVVRDIPVFRVKLQTKEWPKSIVLSAIKYLEFLLKAFRLTKGANFVHCNDLETLPVGFLRKILGSNVKLVYDAHEYEIYRTSSARPIKVWLNKILEKRLIKYADAVITVSDSIADEYKALYNIQRPYLIYNCPHYEKTIDQKNNLFRERFNLNADQKIFLYQGAFSIGRGLESILDAFSQMNDNKYVVIFMGYGVYKEKIVKAAEANDNIFYMPAVSIDEINSYSNSADWGLLTIENVSKSYNYSLPNKLFEYVMAEIPIIAFPTFEIKNKVNNYNLGIVTQEATSASLVDAVKHTDTLKLDSFIEGIQKMKSTFNWEVQEKKLIDIYKSL